MRLLDGGGGGGGECGISLLRPPRRSLARPLEIFSCNYYYCLARPGGREGGIRGEVTGTDRQAKLGQFRVPRKNPEFISNTLRGNHYCL